MTELQSNTLKLIAALFGFGLLAWMDYAGIKDPVLQTSLYEGLTGLGIIHVATRSSSK